MLNLQMPNHVRANKIRIEITELELLVQEERIIENLRGQPKPLINVFNSMTRAGAPQHGESGVLLQARIDALHEQFDTINIDRVSRGVPVTGRFQVGRSIRELILIRNQENSDLPHYNEPQRVKTGGGPENGYQDDSQGADQDSCDGHQSICQEDFRDESEHDSEEEFRKRQGLPLDRADRRQYF
jgi:hypothetical protein